MRTSSILALAAIAAAAAATACSDREPIGPDGAARNQEQAAPPAATGNAVLPPIFIEALTARHEFTDDVAVQVRLKPSGRPRNVVNLSDASNMAVLKITVQPGARFPWHTHPGPVLVSVTQGELAYTYADDCVERDYPAGTAFVDPGASVHYAVNRGGTEAVLIATFLGVPAAGPLTIPVDAAQGTALDAKCGVAAAAVHAH